MVSRFDMRCYIQRSKEMVYEESVSLHEELEYGKEGQIWMQCTGLEDAKGMPIYEGDILTSRDRDLTYYIKWRKSKLKYDFVTVKEEWTIVAVPTLDTVIGNVWEGGWTQSGY